MTWTGDAVEVGDEFYHLPVGDCILIEIIADEELKELLGIEASDGVNFGRLLHPVEVSSKVGTVDSKILLDPESIVAVPHLPCRLLIAQRGRFQIVSVSEILSAFHPPE